MINPKTRHKEFGGTLGALAISLGLPLWTVALWFLCNEQGCPVYQSWDSYYKYLVSATSSHWISTSAVLAYLAWFLGLVVLDRIVPGAEVDGVELRDGTRLKYKFNGTWIVLLLVSSLLARAWATNWALPELVFVYDHLLQLTIVAILFAFALASYCYAVSFIGSSEPSSSPKKNKSSKKNNVKLLAVGGNTGSVIYDWFIGRELNPRIGNFDIKVFCEMRPGLLLWVIINLSMAHHQYSKYGYVSDSMVLVNLVQNWYVFEGTLYEQGLVSMIDVTTDGFGFMLAFGDLALVPFTYTMQTRFLADNPVHLGWIKCLAIVLVYFAGLYIFRASNNQKARFKSGHPSASHLKYIQTPSGSKLIVSGWWGMSRHINYFGDWLTSAAYCLPTGFSSPIPYYYLVYFASLLIHRETRDEQKCAAKYGDTWLEYKRRVRWKIIPYVF